MRVATAAGLYLLSVFRPAVSCQYIPTRSPVVDVLKCPLVVYAMPRFLGRSRCLPFGTLRYKRALKFFRIIGI